MASNAKPLWQKLVRSNPGNPDDKVIGRKLFQEFTRHGYIQLAPAKRITLSPSAVIDFYRRLILVRTASSPVVRRRDDRWLRSSDFQFLNVDDYGSFFRMFLEVPRLRSDAVILYPVTEGEKRFPLQPKSHSHLDRRYSDPFLESCGFTLEDQFNLLIAALHLCGKRVGTYLSTLIHPESAVIYRKPEFFHWHSTSYEPLSKVEIIGKVHALVNEEFEKTGIYDYTFLRNRLKIAGISVGDENQGVCFDFTEPSVLEYFSRIFPSFQSQFPLDFVYLSFPASLSAADVSSIYKSMRNADGLKRYTGWVCEIADVQSPPADPCEPVVLVQTDRDPIPLDEESLHLWFGRLGNLFEKNKGRKIPVSQGIFLHKDVVPQKEEMLRHLFLSRFSGVSLFRRPLILDGDMTELQNRMEDIYQRYRTVLEKGELLQVVADEHYAWWLIHEKGRLLIPVLALDGPEKKVGTIKIDYSSITGKSSILSVVDYDFSSSQGSLFLSADNSLSISDLKPGGFRLFSLQ